MIYLSLSLSLFSSLSRSLYLALSFSVYVSACLSVCVFVYVFICLPIYPPTHTNIYIYTYIYVCLYLCSYLCICLYILLSCSDMFAIPLAKIPARRRRSQRSEARAPLTPAETPPAARQSFHEELGNLVPRVIGCGTLVPGAPKTMYISGSFILVKRLKTTGIPEAMVCRILMLKWSVESGCRAPKATFKFDLLSAGW